MNSDQLREGMIIAINYDQKKVITNIIDKSHRISPKWTSILVPMEMRGRWEACWVYVDQYNITPATKAQRFLYEMSGPFIDRETDAL